ncbi:hypothetical protein ACFX2J_020667 [Malus domestica]|nr:UDP-glycosyltransferase 89A2-like [Malus domestica]
MSARTHILVFPYPAQGHMLPLLDLTHQLLLRGITVTVLVTPKNLPALTPLLSANPSPSPFVQTLVLPFPPHPKIPPGLENVKDIGPRGNLAVIDALTNLHDPIVHWFNSHPNPPTAIISDFFLGWTLPLARQLGIRRITFYSSGAFLASIADHCWRNLDIIKSSLAEFPDVPRSPSFKAEHLPSLPRRYRESEPESERMRNAMLANTESWGCIFNSFHELEGEYLQHLKTKMGHPRVYGVGPLSLLASAANGGNLERANPNTDTRKDNVLAWLDGCPEGSVLYVCFGSQTLLNKQQMEALASGLEQSGARFVWVVKTSLAGKVNDGSGVVPDGFEERVAGRGLLIKGWAPQVMILGHRAVGGFLSHCGWNSVLEGIVGGVLILSWPMNADQFVNAKLLVEYMGVGVKVCEGADGVPDSAELGKAIAESISGESPEKVRAKELRDKAVAAVGDGGSSSKDLDELVKELGQIKVR